MDPFKLLGLFEGIFERWGFLMTPFKLLGLF
jgi:hypothetical protein